MTWSAKFTVQDIGDGPAPIDVLAVAPADDVVSNTEGNIASMELRIQFDEDEVALRPGDVITGHGSFVGTPPAAAGG